jgi:CheY-like chemotaxis protein
MCAGYSGSGSLTSPQRSNWLCGTCRGGQAGNCQPVPHRRGLAGRRDTAVRHGPCGENTGFPGFLVAAMRGARMTCDYVRMAFGVLIVDDSRLFLEAACVLLEREGLRVVGVAATSAEALQRAQELRPEVVLVDIMLGDESGFDLARQLAGYHRDGPAVILISTHAAADFADLIAESPAAGFVPKQELSADAIRRIIDGREPGGAPGAAAR